jgi:hypothetical protein
MSARHPAAREIVQCHPRQQAASTVCQLPPWQPLAADTRYGSPSWPAPRRHGDAYVIVTFAKPVTKVSWPCIWRHRWHDRGDIPPCCVLAASPPVYEAAEVTDETAIREKRLATPSFWLGTLPPPPAATRSESAFGLSRFRNVDELARGRNEPWPDCRRTIRPRKTSWTGSPNAEGARRAAKG